MEIRELHTSTKFEREVELAKKRGKDFEKLKEVIGLLLEKKTLPKSLSDHPLKGEWKGYRDLHIEPDWLLIYKADAENLWLVRTGSHVDIFGK
jgi:mRNA interferase YafQ